MATEKQFRRIALGLRDAVEGEHMGHPDFRANGRIFATLHGDGAHGMVKLTPNQQEPLVRGEPEVFQPASGAWGQRGATMVHLADADESTVRQALMAAWRSCATVTLVGAIPLRIPRFSSGLIT